MMNEVTNHMALRVFALILLIAALPTLVLGDVHFEGETHPCERDQHGIGADLPWHPHETCESEHENNHAEFTSSLQKVDDSYVIITSNMIHEHNHNHNDCRRASFVTDAISPLRLDIITLFNTLLI